MQELNKKLNLLVKAKKCDVSKSSKVSEDYDSSKERSSEDSGKSTGVKRTRSPYLFFCMEERPKLMKKHPELKFGEVYHELSQLWADLAETKKNRFIKLSEEDRKRYVNEKS